MRRIHHLGTFLFGLATIAALPASAGPSILFDANTGHVIESDSPFQRWYPASLTKLMTTYVAFRMVQSGEVTLESPIRMSKHAAKEPPSKMGYTPGSILTLDNALKILMVKSANDVAMAVGESLGGSEVGFAARMNQESQRLGMTGSHWTNPNGLHDDNQYTTARDLAILSAALRRDFPQYAGYFALEGLAVGKKAIPNHNELIGRFEGADGMKTGYTCPSGFNLVASATRDGRTVMAVVIGSKSPIVRAEKAAALLAKGFVSSTVGTPTLDQLQPSGTSENQAVNMYNELCSKQGREAARKAEKEKKAASKVAQTQSPYAAQLARPRRLVAVALGGATGPVPKAMAAIAIAEAAAADDVPLPTWRPDLPMPVGAEPVVMQGDSAASGQL